MLRRGYAILVEAGSDEHGPLYRRALDFDENTHEYIVAGLPDPDASLVGHPDESDDKPLSKTASGERRKNNARRASAKRTAAKERIPARSAKAVAVPRTSGG
jgi:hypothetical protein